MAKKKDVKKEVKEEVKEPVLEVNVELEEVQACFDLMKKYGISRLSDCETKLNFLSSR